MVREGLGAGGEMTQALYAHMNNKTIKKILKNFLHL
jgi:NaMN:DMB phosphoribosyltransferase